MSDPAVLIVEDDPHLREALYDTLTGESLSVLTAENGVKALEILNSEEVGLVLSDLQMEPMDGATLLRNIRNEYPSVPAILMTAHASVESAIDVMRNGASDYLVKPFDAQKLVGIVSKFLVPQKAADGPVVNDPSSRELMRIAARVASTEATVTISGESGCGKEVIARYIHQQSTRADEAFIALNCAAIPENMLEAVLFGYEKGAFTGAANAHLGKFEQANNGTLLLDEISEMDLALQAKLLRVIQEKEVERIGGRKTIALNVRVLATTNRDLKQYVADGQFREDLFYRLNVFPLHILPLRERSGDVVPLAERFLHRESKKVERNLSECARQRLLQYSWPGNVRELDNLIQRTLIFHRGATITAADLAFEVESESVIASIDDSGLHQGLKDHEFQLIIDALQACNGRRAVAATNLGISPRTLRYKLARMRECGIDIPGGKHE